MISDNYNESAMKKQMRVKSYHIRKVYRNLTAFVSSALSEG